MTARHGMYQLWRKYRAYSRVCPKWKLDNMVQQQVEIQRNLSFTKARHVDESSSPAVKT